jgi:hypothetical protein
MNCIICKKEIAIVIYDNNIIGDDKTNWKFINHECDEEKLMFLRKKYK